MADLNVCRICLVHADSEKLQDIYESGPKLQTEIFLISGIKVMEFTSYEVPALICESCIKDLKVAIMFRNRARSSDKSYFRAFSFDVEELNWNKKLLNLKKNDSDIIGECYEEDPAIKCETIVEEYLESDQELELGNTENFEDIIAVEESKEEIKFSKSTGKIFQCEFCMQILSSKNGLDYHLKAKHNHNVAKMFYCEICHKYFPFQKTLNRHLTQNHSIEPAIYHCEECPKTFTSSRMLSIHMNKDHDPDAPGEFQCLDCTKIFSTRRKLKKHASDAHSKTKKIKAERTTHGPCAVCGKCFKSRGQLVTHERTHIPIDPKDYYFCDLCGNKFKAKSPLLTHIKLRHLAKVRFHCADCPGRSWATKYALQSHIKVFHFNIRDFRCEICGKGFGAKDKLTAHIRIHTGEQPFQCQFCGKKYTHQTDYIRHKWSHTGERRYTCQLCKQGYIKKSQLESHRCPWKQ